MLNQSLSTGFDFDYWNSKEPRTAPHRWFNQSHVIREQQYSPSQLQVAPHFTNLKEEILSTGHVTPRQFQQNIVEKASRFMTTSMVKEMHAVLVPYLPTGIEEGSCVTEEHLQALLLFTDFATISTVFAQSHRKEDIQEPIEHLTARNGKFYWMSRRLKELVEHWGSRVISRKATSPHSERTVKGPFYCGLNAVLNTPMGLTLHGPFSTTKSRMVAMCFAREGMLIVVDVTALYYSPKTFGTSSFSAYCEEDEYLFFGGQEPVQIQNIIAVESSKNYKKSMKALFVFESMICGRRTRRISDSADKYIARTLQYLVDDNDGNRAEDENQSAAIKLDQYEMDQFNLMRFSKDIIILNSWCLDRLYPTSLSNVVMNPMRRNAYDGVVNMPKISFLRIFGLIRRLIIHTTSRRGKVSYPFNVQMLLSDLMKQTDNLSPDFKMIIKARARPHLRRRDPPENIPSLLKRLQEQGIPTEDLERLRKVIDDNQIDLKLMRTLVFHADGASPEILSSFGSLRGQRILRNTLKVYDESDDSSSDDMSSDDEGAEMLKSQTFLRRSWIHKMWNNQKTALSLFVRDEMSGWSVAFEVSGKHQDEDHLIIRREVNADEVAESKDPENDDEMTLSSAPIGHFKISAREPKAYPGDYFKVQYPNNEDPRGEPSFIEFKWNKDFKERDQCDTTHMLYLLQCACDLHRRRVIERNKYFMSINRPDRYLSHVDTPQIITNFVNWYNEDKANNVFTGEMLKNKKKMYIINDLICGVGHAKKGEAARIYQKLMNDVVIEYDEWTDSLKLLRNNKLKLETWGLYKFNFDEKVLEECTVEDVVALFTFRSEFAEARKEKIAFESLVNSMRESVEDVVDGVFAQIERTTAKPFLKITQIDGWKEKIVKWIRGQQIDGKLMKETRIQNLAISLRIMLEPDEKKAKKFTAPCGRMLKICKLMPVHRILQMAYAPTLIMGYCRKMEKELILSALPDGVIDIILNTYIDMLSVGK